MWKHTLGRLFSFCPVRQESDTRAVNYIFLFNLLHRICEDDAAVLCKTWSWVRVGPASSSVPERRSNTQTRNMEITAAFCVQWDLGENVSWTHLGDRNTVEGPLNRKGALFVWRLMDEALVLLHSQMEQIFTWPLFPPSHHFSMCLTKSETLQVHNTALEFTAEL